MSKKQRTVLWLPKWTYTVDAIWSIVEEQLSRGCKVHMLLYSYNDEEIQKLHNAGVEVHLYNEDDFRRSVPAWIRKCRLHDPFVRIRAKQEMERLFAQISPDCVFSTGETRLLARPIIRRANQLNIPTIDVSWSFTNPQKDYELQRKDLIERFGSNVVDRSFMFNFDAKGQVRKQRDTRFERIMLKVACRPKLARLLSNVLYCCLLPIYFFSNTNYRRNGSGLGCGEAKYLTCIGPAMADLFAEQGVPRDKLYVAGLPELDRLHQLTKEEKRSYRQDLCDQLGFNSQKPIVFWAPRAYVEDGYNESEVSEQERSIALALLEHTQEVQVVCKLHPRTDLCRFKSWLPDDNRLVIVKDADKVALIAACDAFISTHSTVVLWALALDKSVMTYNILRLAGGDVFRDRVGGVTHVTALDEIPAAIDTLFCDSEVKKQLSIGRAKARKTHMVFDGEVTRRISNLGDVI